MCGVRLRIGSGQSELVDPVPGAAEPSSQRTDVAFEEVAVSATPGRLSDSECQARARKTAANNGDVAG